MRSFRGKIEGGDQKSLELLLDCAQTLELEGVNRSSGVSLGSEARGPHTSLPEGNLGRKLSRVPCPSIEASEA